MNVKSPILEQEAASQISKAVSRVLRCEPRKHNNVLEWDAKDGNGIVSAQLKTAADSSYELLLTLAAVPESASTSIYVAWKLSSAVIEETGQAALPLVPSKIEGDLWRIAATVRLQNVPLDLPRLKKLSHTLEVLNVTAKNLREITPSISTVACQQVPAELKRFVENYAVRSYPDSGQGAISESLARKLTAGIPIAIVGDSLRVRLELDRLSRCTPTLVTLLKQIPIPELPSMVKKVTEAGLMLVLHISMLRSRISPYEQGRDLDAVLHEMASSDSPLIIYGNRDELESQLGIGQGRSYSPLYPVIETLEPAKAEDLTRAALAEQKQNTLSQQAEGKIVSLILDVIKEYTPGQTDKFIRPLANLAIRRCSKDRKLRDVLVEQIKDLAGRHDTFGVVGAASPVARPAWMQERLIERFSGSEFEDSLHREVIGQKEAVCEVSQKLFYETICRPATEPIRILQAGPVGTGKSLTAKILATHIGWDYHYIDACAFDSSHSVMTSLAGSSPGIVNSYNDGILAQYSRRPCVVEVADLDHANDMVRGSLCDFFLRILQEGTLQTGSGKIVRTIPQIIFVFTSNVAFSHGEKVTSHFGFHNYGPTRQQIREKVIEKMTRFLGHAFFSRVGEPIVYNAFTQDAAAQVAANEMTSLIEQVFGAQKVTVSSDIGMKLVNNLPNLEGGARQIIDEVRKCVADSVQAHKLTRTSAVSVAWNEGKLSISQLEEV